VVGWKRRSGSGQVGLSVMYHLHEISAADTNEKWNSLRISDLCGSKLRLPIIPETLQVCICNVRLSVLCDSVIEKA
jgi:hypothetical protein